MYWYALLLDIRHGYLNRFSHYDIPRREKTNTIDLMLTSSNEMRWIEPSVNFEKNCETFHNLRGWSKRRGTNGAVLTCVLFFQFFPWNPLNAFVHLFAV